MRDAMFQLALHLRCPGSYFLKHVNLSSPDLVLLRYILHSKAVDSLLSLWAQDPMEADLDQHRWQTP